MYLTNLIAFERLQSIFLSFCFATSCDLAPNSLPASVVVFLYLIVVSQCNPLHVKHALRPLPD